MAKSLVQGGIYDIVLAVGFQKMDKGPFQIKYKDRVSPLDKLVTRSKELKPYIPYKQDFPLAPQLFASAGCEHIRRHGTLAQHFGRVAEKNHRHSVNNPYAQSRQAYSLDEIMRSAYVTLPLTKLQCCPTSDGAGAALIVSERVLAQLGIQDQAVEILALEMGTDTGKAYDSALGLVGYEMTKEVAAKALAKAKVKIEDISVIELHDCFSTNELITYEALGLCKEGEAGKFIDQGNGTYGSPVVINPSGGLIAKGHPLGATGLAQCAEICWQLRGLADKRQVEGASLGLQHNLGLGGACVIGIYHRKGKKSRGVSDPALLKEMESKSKSERATL